MMKFIISLFLIVFQLISIQAQDVIPEKKKKSNHFLEIGLGLNYHALRDNGTSPLMYKGYLPAIHIQYFWTSEKFIGLLDEAFSIGYLKTRNFSSTDNNKAVSYNNELSFTALYKIRNFSKNTFYLGWEFGTMSNLRVNEKFNNANLNYDFVAYLAPTAMLEHNISWHSGNEVVSLKKRERNLKFQYILSIPVISSVLRPGYVTISDFVDINTLPIKLENIKITSFNHYFLMKNKFIVYYVLHNNNMLKLSYGFNYFSLYRNYNPVKGMYSTFMASIVFRFTNN